MYVLKNVHGFGYIPPEESIFPYLSSAKNAKKFTTQEDAQAYKKYDEEIVDLGNHIDLIAYYE